MLCRKLWATVVLGLAAGPPKYVAAQQCGVAGSGDADELYGTSGCPCLVDNTASGVMAFSPEWVPNAFNITLNYDGQGPFDDGVERNYGHLCGTHDWGSADWCLNMSDPATLASWCSATWCWVDPDNCDVASSGTSYFPNVDLYYSYAACDSVDSYSSDNDAMADSVDASRVKLDAEMAIGLINDITNLPSKATFVQLLADLDMVDTQDLNQLRTTLLMQTSFLLSNRAPFGCVHVADSRGMWYGLFPNLDMGYRAPDPATADMYGGAWFRPFTPDTLSQRQLSGDLDITGGIFSPPGGCLAVDPRMRCNWPTWVDCDGTGERIPTETLVGQYDGSTVESFSIGAGNTCIGVSVVTSLIDGAGQQAHLETVETCLNAGENAFVHTVQNNHVVELFFQGGYVHTGHHTGAGNTSSFVVGQCTHILVRVTTISVAEEATWSINNADNNWDIVVAEPGTHEEERCVYDHDYVVSRDSPDGYDGTIEIFSFTRCSPDTCCMDDQLYFENAAAASEAASHEPGELYFAQQYDPRARAWYYNAPMQFALSGQQFGWSNVYAPESSQSQLTVSATRILPGDSGSSGTAAHGGTCLGDYYVGANFTAASDELVVNVDGSDISVPLIGDLTAASDGVAALNAGLGHSASAELVEGGNRILIASELVGEGSSVSIDGTSAAARAFGFVASTQTDGKDATAGTYVGERVPHRASGPTAPARAAIPAPWVGFDFSTAPEDLVLTVDGVNVTIPLTTNLDDYSDAAVVITAGLAGAGTAAVDADGKYLTITSGTTGPGSSVALSPESGDMAKKMLTPVIKSVLTVDIYLDRISERLAETFSDLTVYIVERSTGFLIADSTGNGVVDENGNRMCAVNAGDALVRKSAVILDSLEPKWDDISQKLDETHYYDAVMYQRDKTQDGWGLDWLVVVVTTERCPLGQSIQQQGPIVSCIPCPIGSVSTEGLRCETCPQGRVANREQSECDRCPEGTYHNEAQTQCLECPTFQVASAQGDSCVCAPGYYDSTQVLPACHLGEYDESQTTTADSGLTCRSCAKMACLQDCDDTTLDVQPGWMILEEDQERIVNIYRCNYESACPGGVHRLNVSDCAVGYTSTLCALCEDDYVLDGEGECTPCGKLNKAGFAAAVFLILLLLVLLKNIRVWFNAFGNCATVFGFVDGLQLKPVGKCLIATLQILGGLAANLKVVFPITFQTFLDTFVAYFRFDLVGILIHMEFGCITDGRYGSSLAITFFLIFLVVASVGVYYVYSSWADKRSDISEEERRENAANLFAKFDLDGDGIDRDEVAKIAAKISPDVTDAEINKLFDKADTDGGGTIDFDEFYAAAFEEQPMASEADNDQNPIQEENHLDLAALVNRKREADRITETLTVLFIAVFLLYPSVTNKIFDGLNCRDLGSMNVMDVDYSIDCDATYWQRQFFNGSLVILWPIGLPIVLLIVLYQRRELIRQGDEETLQELDFVIGDYKTEYWYWEVVELGRKLMLTGLIGLVKRGSIAQSFVATIISFFFFAYSVKAQPFKNGSFNAIKIFTEFQIFGILVVCVVLQTNRYGLPIVGAGTADDYGLFQLVLTLGVIPIIIFVLYYNVKLAEEQSRNKDKQSADAEYENPSFTSDADIFDKDDEAQVTREQDAFEAE